MWFVTINTHAGELAFGDVLDRTMFLNVIGQLADRFWREIPIHFPHVRIDAFVVMPNHVHGIIELTTRSVDAAPYERRTPGFGQPVPRSLGTVLGAYKSSVTREVRRLVRNPFSLWQRDINNARIRTSAARDRMRTYIAYNHRPVAPGAAVGVWHGKPQHGMPCHAGTRICPFCRTRRATRLRCPVRRSARERGHTGSARRFRRHARRHTLYRAS